MSQAKTLLSPLTEGERIGSLDVMRGIALLGILLMNITAFGLHHQAYLDPTIQGGHTGWNLNVWTLNNLFFEGTMRAMFSMLFGVGMIIIATRLEKKGGGLEVADIYYRRTIWLFIFGIVHAYLLLWTGEILYQYGLMGLFIFPFRNTATKKLMVAIVALLLVGVGLSVKTYVQNSGAYSYYLESRSLPEDKWSGDMKAGVETWEAVIKSSKPSKEEVEEFTEGTRSGYWGLVMLFAPMNRFWQSTFVYDNIAWDVLPMMLLGILLFRLGVLSANLPSRKYWLMALVGYVIGISVNYYESILILDSNFDVRAMQQAGMTYPVGRVFVSLAHVAVIMLFCKSRFFKRLKESLAAVGRMALTNYIMHSVICAFVFYGIGFSLFGKLQRFELYYVVVATWIFQMILSPIWLRYFRFGPLEWFWRSLTYKKVQPMRKAQRVS